MKFNFLEKFIKKKSINNKNKINKKNLFIFPNLRGFQIGVLIFFCFSVAIFYQNNFALLISIILFIIFFISILISYQNLNNLEFEIIDRILPSNKYVKLNYVLKDETKRDRLNINFEQNNQIINVNPKKITKITFQNKFDKRGVYETPSINFNSVFPFGIISTFGKVFFQKKLIIYPEPIKPPKIILDNLFNKINDGFDYEFDKIEENNNEKNLSKVSWKHYSIKKKFYHKIFKFQKETNNFIIDLELLSSDFEKSLSYASYLIDNFYKLKNPFALKYKNYISDYACSYEHRNKQLTYLANANS